MRAREVLQGILSAYPETGSAAEVLYQIAYCSFAEKEYDRCIQLCEDALKRVPSSEWNSYLQYFIACCHLEMGRKAEAKAAFEKTISLYPGTDWAKNARNTLDTLKLNQEGGS